MFKKILLAALGYVYHFRARLAKALAIPFIASWILTLFILGQPSPGISFVGQILYLFFQMSVVLSIHRIILLGEDSVPAWGAMIWSRDVFRMIAYPLLLGIIVMAIAFLVGLLMALIGPGVSGDGVSPIALGIFVLMLPAFIAIVLMRFSLVFPALAAKEEHTLARSWSLTKDNKMLMFYAVILVPFVCGLPFVLLNMIENAMYFTVPFTFVVSIVGVAALSVAYSTITNRQMGVVKPLIDSGQEDLSP